VTNPAWLQGPQPAISPDSRISDFLQLQMALVGLEFEFSMEMTVPSLQASKDRAESLQTLAREFYA